MATWYYVEDGQQRGPLTEEQLAQLVALGTIRAETLVWNETLTDWQAYGPLRASLVQRQAEELATGSPPSGVEDEPTPLRPVGQAAAVEPRAAGLASVGMPAPAAGAAGQAAPEASGAVRCAECGLPFPPDEVVPIGGQWICAGCKPLALQKVREGVGLSGALEYAGFWIRVGARLIDGIILAVPGVAVVLLVQGAIMAMVVSQSSGGKATPILSALAVAVMVVLLFGAQLAYTVFFLGRYGATPGKMACRLRVVRSDGSPLTYGRALGRYFADLLNGWTFNIGYLIVVFDSEKRALHDHICDTRVVYA